MKLKISNRWWTIRCRNDQAMYFKRPKVSASWLRWTGIVLITFLPILYIIFNRLDPDFGWHVQSGYYIRAHGIPAHDIFSYPASSFRWIDHEWGSDVLLSYGYQLGGYTLLAVVSAGLWTAALLLAAGKRANPFVLLLATTALASFLAVRPTVVTALLFALTLYVLRRHGSRLQWYLPPLFIVWSNLHAGFIAGLGLVGYFMLLRRSKRLGLILLLSVAATFCNAYGVRIYEEIIRTLLSSELHSNIQEWRSFSLRNQAIIYIIFWGAGFWLYSKPFFKRWLTLGPILLLAAVSADRNVPLFVLATIHDLSDYLKLTAAEIPQQLQGVRRAIILTVQGSLLVVLGYALHLTYSYTPHNNREASYPVAAVAYLQQHPCPGRLYNNYNYGGYLIWKLPSSKDYIDGRMPTWEPYMSTYVGLEKHFKNRYQAEFARYDIQCALLSSGADRIVVNTLEQAHWHSVSSANSATLLYSPAAYQQTIRSNK